MCKQGTPEKCEAKADCRNPVWSHNRTVRDRQSKIAKIMCICSDCYTRITGAR